MLAFHARTEAQVRARLARAGLAEAADEVVAWLLRLGYLDDAAFARARARSLLAAGRLGPRAAERRLRAAGIDAAGARAAVDAALQARAGGREGEPGATPERPEVALCREAAARKLRGAPMPAGDPPARARLARFLLGRGFSAEAVRAVVGVPFDDA